MQIRVQIINTNQTMTIEIECRPKPNESCEMSIYMQ